VRSSIKLARLHGQLTDNDGQRSDSRNSQIRFSSLGA
jgi:hypothetical protein